MVQDQITGIFAAREESATDIDSAESNKSRQAASVKIGWQVLALRRLKLLMGPRAGKTQRIQKSLRST